MMNSCLMGLDGEKVFVYSIEFDYFDYMSTKFQNKYRVESTRLKNWDYASQAAYFITICTKYRQHYFGEIQNRKMCLSQMGNIAETEWHKTLEIRPDMNLQLDAFVVMPNHVHGIIVIGNNEYNGGAEPPQ